ncbi:MAG TPA: Ig-like domain-containing protein, partial [Candidatus Limnocylindria bacterium]
GQAIALDASGAAYVTGLANASDFPTTPGAYDTTANGSSDAFVTKLITVGAPYTLTLAPATDTNEVGNPHTVTATVTDFGAQPVSGATARFTVTGKNPTSGSAVTNASGSATFTYTGTVAGLDTINAFADTNDNGAQDAGEPGAVATKTWTPGPPATLTLTPATATNVVNFTHCVTAAARDVYGNVVPGATVIFSVGNATATSASPTGASVVTNASGQAQFCFSASLPGTNTIHAFADTNLNGTQDATTVPPEPFADATKTWIVPVSACDVTVTVGGAIVASNGDEATFGGAARVTGATVQGQQTYQDHGPVAARSVNSIELLALVCDGTAGTATIFGTATIDGSGAYFFRIDLVDMGEPGTSDTYGITLSDGYSSGEQTLHRGNIKIHK